MAGLKLLFTDNYCEWLGDAEHDDIMSNTYDNILILMTPQNALICNTGYGSAYTYYLNGDINFDNYLILTDMILPKSRYTIRIIHGDGIHYLDGIEDYTINATI